MGRSCGTAAQTDRRAQITARNRRVCGRGPRRPGVWHDQESPSTDDRRPCVASRHAQHTLDQLRRRRRGLTRVHGPRPLLPIRDDQCQNATTPLELHQAHLATRSCEGFAASTAADTRSPSHRSRTDDCSRGTPRAHQATPGPQLHHSHHGPIRSPLAFGS